jgi:hypothetical protein
MKYGLMYSVQFKNEIKFKEAETIMEELKKKHSSIERIDFHNAKMIDQTLEELRHVNDDIPDKDRLSSN